MTSFGLNIKNNPTILEKALEHKRIVDVLVKGIGDNKELLERARSMPDPDFQEAVRIIDAKQEKTSG